MDGTRPTQSMSGSRALARTCANVYHTYELELAAALKWFDEQELSVSSLENFCSRVRRVSEALGDEADALERRAQLRDAATIEAPPLLGVAVEGDRGLELHPFSLTKAIDDLRTTTGPAASVLEESGGGARKDAS